MHFLLKLFLQQRHFGLNCLHAQTFIFERIATNEWALVTNKPKLFTIHILPFTHSQTTFLKTTTIHHRHHCKCNFVLSTLLQKLPLKVRESSNRAMASLWSSIMFCRNICKSFMNLFRCFLKVPTLVMVVRVVVWSLVTILACLFIGLHLKICFLGKILKLAFDTHKQTHVWPHT